MLINSQVIRPGERVLTRLVISRLPSRTVIDIPVYVFRAQEPGPTVLLMAGMHGDEVNGIETIRRLVRRELLQPLRGTIIAYSQYLRVSQLLPRGAGW
jgi:predicted deacylase